MVSNTLYVFKVIDHDIELLHLPLHDYIPFKLDNMADMEPHVYIVGRWYLVMNNLNFFN